MKALSGYRFPLRSIALFLSVCLVGTGCGDRLPVEEDRKEEVIMPLAVGNMWIGELRTFDEEGNVLTRRLDTLQIVDTIRYEGELWYRTKPLIDDREVWYANRPNGLYRTEATGTGDSINVGCRCLYLAYPAFPRATVIPTNTRVALTPNGPISYELSKRVDFVDAVVTLPVGTFISYAYSYDYRVTDISSPDGAFPVLRPEEYYTPSAGPIRIDWFQGTLASPNEANLVKQWRLVDVHLN